MLNCMLLEEEMAASLSALYVRLIEAAGISLLERLKREGENSQADVILLADAATITNAAKAGLFQPINSTELKNNVPIPLRDPGNEWFALTTRIIVMVISCVRIVKSENC